MLKVEVRNRIIYFIIGIFDGNQIGTNFITIFEQISLLYIYLAALGNTNAIFDSRLFIGK